MGSGTVGRGGGYVHSSIAARTAHAALSQSSRRSHSASPDAPSALIRAADQTLNRSRPDAPFWRRPSVGIRPPFMRGFRDAALDSFKRSSHPLAVAVVKRLPTVGPVGVHRPFDHLVRDKRVLGSAAHDSAPQTGQRWSRCSPGTAATHGSRQSRRGSARTNRRMRARQPGQTRTDSAAGGQCRRPPRRTRRGGSPSRHRRRRRTGRAASAETLRPGNSQPRRNLAHSAFD